MASPDKTGGTTAGKPQDASAAAAGSSPKPPPSATGSILQASGSEQQTARPNRRYSATSSSGRRVSQVSTPDKPGVFSATDDKPDQQQQAWPQETPSQLRERLVRQLQVELRRAYAPNSDGQAPVDYKVDENPERGNWSGKLDFLLSCLGYAVGLGNVWRFPYMCFANGGGAFLIPYTIFLLLCGIPVFLLDLSLGQFTSEGPATCWEFAPLFNGVGYAMTFISTVVSIYYNMIIAYSIYYLFASMTSRLPWDSCENAWNSEFCIKRPVMKCTGKNLTMYANGTCFDGTFMLGIYNRTLLAKSAGKALILSADEYYTNEVLKASKGIDIMGTPDWKLALCLLASWIIVFCCMAKGIKTSGKVVYFTSLFPYLVLIILFFRGVTLSNALEGIRFYMVPDFSKLANADVWKDAAGQIFFSLSCSWGGLMSLSSYNRFHNNVIRDTFFVTVANCVTSVFAGFVIFSFIGHLAGKLNVEVKDVSKSSFGLAFVIYPEAVNLLPGSSFWAILFFVMLLTLGVDSQFAMVETLITSLCDQFRVLRRYKPPLIGVVCIALFLLGLPYTCPGGSYLMEIVDSYAGSWTILLIGFFECISVGWIYGRPGFGQFHRFSEDIGLMMRGSIWPIWRYLWQYISPTLIFGIMLFNWIKYARTEKGKGTGDFFPLWADILGWLVAFTSVAIILGTGLYKLCMEPPESPWKERLFNLSLPSYKWGPSLPKHRLLMAPYLEKLGALEHFYLNPAKLIKYTEVFPDDDAPIVGQLLQRSAQSENASGTHTNGGFAGNSTGTAGVAANAGTSISTDV